MAQRDKDSALARSGFESLVRQAQGDARKLASLSAIARSIGLRGRARELANEACALDPADPEVSALARSTLAADVPEWHFPMVRDQRRNAVYDEALRRAVGPDSRVLDIGSGTGLLAMMAARAGAAAVTTCEMNPIVAEAAAEIVRHNGYADRIKVIPKASGELDAERDLGGRADIIVSEIFSNELLGEAVIPVMEDAIARLLAPGGQVIPSAATVRVALAWWPGLDERRLQRISGFDLSPFNRLGRTPYRLEVGDPELSLRSEAADLFSFDFSAGGRFPGGRSQLDLIPDGVVNGVVQWIRLQLDPQVRYENRPGPGEASCWGCLFHPFAGSAEPVGGSAVRIHASHNRNQLQIWKGA
ncbi:MAG: 50S ribosomal protein L11 methyltransferase [Allosphingosinicella sp.]